MSAALDAPVARTVLRAPVVVVVPVPGRRARRRNARRALLWGLALVALGHLAFAVALETALPHVRDPEYGYREARVLELQRANPERPLVLVLGTSRAQNAIDPEAMGMPLVYNFGLSGARPVHMRLALARLRAAGARPTAVLIELHPLALLAPEPADAVFPDAGRLTAADLRELDSYLNDRTALQLRWALARANPLYDRRGALMGRYAPLWVPRVQRAELHRADAARAGFVPKTEEGADERRPALLDEARTAYAARLGANTPAAPLDRAYRDLLDDCRAAGARVAFFQTPESPTFRNWYSPPARAHIEARARDLGAPVFTAPDTFSEDDFADGHHMLRPAATRYSRWLADAHLRPWSATR